MEEIVTYVEMTAPDQLVPAAPVPGLTLEPVDHGSPLVPSVLARIGADYHWKSARRTGEEWAAWFAGHPAVSRVWLHTSTKDHPRALPNYHRRGLRTFKTET